MERTFKNENGHLIAKVSFGAEEVGKATEKGVRKLCENVTVPGFRKGKAPVETARLRLRSNDIAQATIDDLLQRVDAAFMKDDEFSSYIKDSKILASFRPSVSIDKFSTTEAEFTISYTLRPVCSKLGEYHGLKTDITEKDVTEDDINAFIQHLAKDNAELVPTEEGRYGEYRFRRTHGWQGIRGRIGEVVRSCPWLQALCSWLRGTGYRP